MNRFLIPFLFLSQLSFGQTIAERMSPEACECFESKINQKEKEEIILRNFASICMNGIMKNYEDELQSLLDIESSKSQYEQGRELGLKIYFELQNQMILHCDSFFEFMDKMKSKRELLSPENSQDQILQLTEEINSGENSEVKYYERALIYYSSNDIIMAMKDINLSIEKNNEYAAAYLLKGQLYEAQNKFKKAHEFYLKAYEITQSNEFMLLVKIAERKIKSN